VSLPSRGQDSAHAADLALVRAAARGDEGARAELARRLAAVLRILAALNRRHGSRLTQEDVEDLAQDTFLLAWRKLDTFGGHTELEGWLYRFCALEYLNRLRRNARAPIRAVLDPEELGHASSEERLDGRIEAIERLLAELGPPDEDVIRLKHYEGLSFESIAGRLAIPPSTIKTRYYRGIAWMQRRLRGELQETGS
jgi:RNA polymerase sigma factor (sigma-70 family)